MTAFTKAKNKKPKLKSVRRYKRYTPSRIIRNFVVGSRDPFARSESRFPDLVEKGFRDGHAESRHYTTGSFQKKKPERDRVRSDGIRRIYFPAVNGRGPRPYVFRPTRRALRESLQRGSSSLGARLEISEGRDVF